jgi:gliding motility-associated-like protein
LTASNVDAYSWDPPIGLSAITGASVQASPPATQKYTVTGTTTGCPGSSTADITVVVRDKTVLVVSPDPTICSGENTQLKVTGSKYYTWNTNPPNTTDSVLSVSPKATFIYVINAKNSYGCPAQASIKVNVNPNPVLGISGPPGTCLGDNITLLANGSVTSYKWGGLPSGVQSGPTVSFPAATNFVMTLEGKDANGCPGKATFNVVVVPPPVPKLNGPFTICKGETVELIVSGAAGSSIVWSNDAKTQSIFVTPQVSTKYKVTVNNAYCKASDTMSVIIKNAPPLQVFIPNSFSPDGNSLNEVFYAVPTEKVTEFTGQIFNRWGQLYHEWSIITDGWDGQYQGRLVEEDVYVYKLRYMGECKDATTQVGTVTVKR